MSTEVKYQRILLKLSGENKIFWLLNRVFTPFHYHKVPTLWRWNRNE